MSRECPLTTGCRGNREGEETRMEMMVCRNLQLTHLLLSSLMLAVPSVL